jgi:hypothetical protein
VRGRVVATGNLGPEVERRVGRVEVERAFQDRHDRRELLAVLATVLHDVRLVGPCQGGSCLHRRIHGAAMVGAVQKKLLDQLGTTGDES